ncbi:uncharacterized protein LOC135392349 [Ornithodoros turicata]|uniref:uncharacterized protein LOC135392349 n=1 Tax=Ornithodoros turicata TaxID=34597 RepID=UPI0031388EB2
MFRDVSYALPGCAHDASVLNASELYRAASQLIPQGSEDINGTQVPYVILGDPACPLLSWLVKPFPHSARITPQQQQFNEHLSAGRVVVEHAFGRLKSRWCCVMKRTDIDHKFLPTLVATVCILHNICEEGNGVNPSWSADISETETRFPQSARQANRQM